MHGETLKFPETCARCLHKNYRLLVILADYSYVIGIVTRINGYYFARGF